MPMKIGDALPSFEGATEWFNELEQIADQYVKGQPALVHFWATSCGICKTNMPKLQELTAKYQDLKVVAVHFPRYAADTDVEKVKADIAAYSITEVCAVDNQHKLKNAFQNEQGWVPVYYLFDAEGKLKSRAAGEFGIGVLTTALEKMFAPQSVSATA
jgi:thiol-disulfide isomerase/thioredoxin